MGQQEVFNNTECWKQLCFVFVDQRAEKMEYEIRLPINSARRDEQHRHPGSKTERIQNFRISLIVIFSLILRINRKETGVPEETHDLIQKMIGRLLYGMPLMHVFTICL